MIGTLKKKVLKKEEKALDIRVMVVKEINSDNPKLFEYKSKDISGLPKNRQLAANIVDNKYQLTFSNDSQRLFLGLQKKKSSDNKKQKKDSDKLLKEEPTVNVWHWKDKKLISQQMKESKRVKNKIYKAVFDLKSKKLIELTGDEIQRIYRVLDTDAWAVGTDNRAYLSDWDVEKVDLYKIDLTTGEKNLIVKKYNGRMNISPDGERLILWKDGHYWCYDFKNHKQNNLTANLAVSFLNREWDYYGSSPAYGFGGWIKDKNSIIVNHKLDLWKLPLDGQTQAVNLTKAIRGEESIRFRIEDRWINNKPEMEERYIDLSDGVLLSAFDIKSKYAGYYKLASGKLTNLIYKPASYSRSWWRSGLIKAKKSKAMVFKMGNFKDYPESYLSDSDFSKPLRITFTNPQQSQYKWGHRILIDYSNDDGVPLQGVLSIPDDYKKGEKLSMIVYSYEKLSDNRYHHSTPTISGTRIDEMMFLSEGYLFLQPDIHFNVGTPHTDMHECIDAAIKKVIALGYVDEQRIGYEGFSFGGHCGMFISTQNNKFAAIAAGAGVSNLVQGFNIDIVRDGSNEQDYYMTSQGRLGADPTAKPEMYISESAVFSAGNMNTPLLLYHGTADSVVQWEHSFGLYSILRFLKKPVIFLSYRGEGHGIRKKANRLDIQKRLKGFFDHYLKGKKAPKWVLEGLPFIEKPQPDKKKGKQKPKRTVPQWK